MFRKILQEFVHLNREFSIRDLAVPAGYLCGDELGKVIELNFKGTILFPSQSQRLKVISMTLLPSLIDQNSKMSFKAMKDVKLVILGKSECDQPVAQDISFSSRAASRVGDGDREDGEEPDRGILRSISGTIAEPFSSSELEGFWFILIMSFGNYGDRGYHKVSRA